MRPKVLITDIDNTLFSWVDYFAPSFRAMVRLLSQETGINEEDLYSSFRHTFQRKGSVEFRGAIQDNSLIKPLPKFERERLVKLGASSFSEAAKKYLQPYAEVRQTLERLRKNDVSVVAVTNSDTMRAMTRLKRMGLTDLMNGLIAWNSGEVHSGSADIAYDDAIFQKASRDNLAWVHTLPRHLIKPNSGAYELAIESLEIASPTDTDVWVIGDSVSKDLVPAAALGFNTVWASYGHNFKQENFDTLLKISHWSENKIKDTYRTDSLVFDHTANNFSNLIDIIMA